MSQESINKGVGDHQGDKANTCWMLTEMHFALSFLFWATLNWIAALLFDILVNQGLEKLNSL